MHGYTRDESERRAYASLEMVGLDQDVVDRKIQSYSKGMRQKVKVAQSIVHEPELLILDEPLAGTDPVGRKTLIGLINELAEQGIHSIVSSHVLYEIERLTNQVVLISAGQTLATGDFHEIRNLIDKHPHMVNITTSGARELGIALLELENVAAATVIDDQHLSVKTRAPDSFYDQLPKIIVDGGYEVREMFSPDDNLQAVFRYLVK
jgi:ABC-2 type transport system ATP-binding protein